MESYMKTSGPLRCTCCYSRHGYKDTMKGPHVFEQQLVQKLKEFIKHEHFIHEAENIPKPDLLGEGSTSSALIQSASFDNKRVNSPLSLLPGAEEQMRFIDKAMDQGVFYLLGEVEVVAKKDSSLVKKIVVNYAYTFLRKNFRHGEEMLVIPQKRLLKVGMTYEV